MTTKGLEEKVKNFPDRPGIYLMKSERGKVIYVGKAKSLRKRARSYFQRGDDGRVWSPFLASHVADIECIVTDTEKEAIILEDSAIKEYRPRYNIRLKDDKSFLRLKLTTQEQYPRLLITRKVKRDGALYFGPYSSARAARETFRVVNNYFMLRKCSNATFSSRKLPCIYYDMHKCLGPCCGNVDKETYAGSVRTVIAFLQGKGDELIQTLRGRMRDASDRLDFELAGRYRDQIQALQRTVERQKVVSHDETDRDVFGTWQANGCFDVAVLIVRKGKLTGSEPYHFPQVKVPTEEVLGSLLTQFYSSGRPIPKEVILPLTPENVEAFGQWLSDKRGERVNITIPERGSKRRLLEMARLNARTVFHEHQRAALAETDVLAELQRALRLRARPERIEAFDISDISGDLAVGSMVVFEDGRPKKSDYRRFKIRTVEGSDDYAMMREVLIRHMRRATTEGRMPSLIIVDGGKGQLNIALSVFEELQIIDQDVIGIAKEKMHFRHKSDIAVRETDKVYIPHRKDPILLRPASASLRLLQQVRDEAHRFALAYHRKLRSKGQTRSALEDIRGIGPRRRVALLKHFGSPRRLAEATEEEIASVAGVSPSLAQRIKQALYEGTEAGA
ncbi:MAG: excinuclease ABC subunit UvrC, partial [Candidatus Hydrogenedentota bacterium]